MTSRSRVVLSTLPFVAVAWTSNVCRPTSAPVALHGYWYGGTIVPCLNVPSTQNSICFTCRPSVRLAVIVVYSPGNIVVPGEKLRDTSWAATVRLVNALASPVGDTNLPFTPSVCDPGASAFVSTVHV